MQSAATIAATFGISAALAYGLTKARQLKRSTLPEIGTTLRLRAASGVYRSRLLRIDQKGWHISAPLSRNNYVPLRVDEPLTIEAPVPNGVYVFKTVVTGRDADTHEFALKPPPPLTPINRREVVRCDRDEPIRIEGREGHLINISPLGARLQSNQHFPPGDRVRLDLSDGVVYGWVLDSWPTRMGEKLRENLRVRFEVTVDSACG